jgi:hypothetical protein
VPQAGPRRHNVAVRLLDEELVALRDLARRSRRSISDLARDLMDLPPADRALGRRSDRDLRRELYLRLPRAFDGDVASALWVVALHRILETRGSATLDEFLALYTARLRLSPEWIADGCVRTVELSPELQLRIEVGGRVGDEPGVRISPLVPGTASRLPSATFRGADLPTEDEMRRILDDVGERARALAARREVPDA